MAQEILRQVSFNGGELDPRMRARRDTKIFYNMVELAQNLVTTPAGTLEGRPGLSFIDYIRHRLDRVTLSEPLIGVPAGGVAANVLVDDGLLLETTLDLGADAQVLLTLTFAAPTRVGLIDVVDYAVKDGGGGAATPEAPPFQYPYEPPVFEGPIILFGPEVQP